jgi:hypothetical protein
MLLQINNVQILLNFNNGISVRIIGPDKYYYVEVLEYKKNQDLPVIVESYHITNDKSLSQPSEFKLPIKFYFDFEIQIYKVVLNQGLKKIYTHRFNEFGKVIKFNLKTKDYNEAIYWLGYINNYCRLNSCLKIIKSDFSEINHQTNKLFLGKEVESYKTYDIGRFPKSSNDWRTIDPRKEGMIWFGNWKTFWSYEHPRCWTNLTSEEIIKDILGL